MQSTVKTPIYFSLALAATMVVYHAVSVFAQESNATHGQRTVDIKLPISAPTAQQWIVIVDGEKMDIRPATVKFVHGGINVSVSVHDLPPGTLQAAVAILPDGSVYSTPLHEAQ